MKMATLPDILSLQERRRGGIGSIGVNEPRNATPLRFVAYYEQGRRLGRSLALPG